MLAILLCCLLAWTGTHPDSRSSSRIEVRGERLELEIACQALSLIESASVDLDRDLRLSDEELHAGRDELARYLLAHYRISARRDGFVPLAGELTELRGMQGPGGPFAEQWIVCRFTHVLPPDSRELTIRVTLFRENNPSHRDSASIRWRDEPEAGFLFSEHAQEWRFEPLAQRRWSVFAAYVVMGVEHIGRGYDHLAFLLGLIVAARGLRSLIVVVSAFTAAHTLTLACAALGWVEAPARLVELAIALSIAYVGAESLLVRRPASRWPEAFGFGLIHGLGFAGFLAESLIAEPLKAPALVGFNLGVELGQLAVVLAAFVVLRWLPGARDFEGELRAWLAPRWLRMGGSVLVLVGGLYWFAERAGWV